VNFLNRAVLCFAVILWVTSPLQATAQDAPRRLFDGKDLDGWEHVGRGSFTVENGVLKTNGGMGLLWYSKEPLGNVTIRVVYLNPGGVNSGVFIRIPARPTEPWMPVYRGYEVQIYDQSDADDYHYSGALESLTSVMAKPGHPSDWNTMEITLDGPRTIVTINGVVVTDYHEGQAVPPKKERWEPERGPRPIVGYIGLQNYGPHDVVYFREISVIPVRR
jgi:3-keto-disaccharide hydrolase